MWGQVTVVYVVERLTRQARSPDIECSKLFKVIKSVFTLSRK